MATDRHASPRIANPEVDSTVPPPRGGEGSYAGQEGGSTPPATPDPINAGAIRGGSPAQPSAGAIAGQPAEDLPPEAGHRATVDQRTGAVHGSGAGAGGGQAGEDLDQDSGGSNTE